MAATADVLPWAAAADGQVKICSMSSYSLCEVILDQSCGSDGACVLMAIPYGQT
jgi:hypothetical protein